MVAAEPSTSSSGGTVLPVMPRLRYHRSDRAPVLDQNLELRTFDGYKYACGRYGNAEPYVRSKTPHIGEMAWE